jgi:hypothetical protein
MRFARSFDHKGHPRKDWTDLAMLGLLALTCSALLIVIFASLGYP